MLENTQLNQTILDYEMKKIALTLALLTMAHSTFAYEATVSATGEILFSTAISSVSSEVSSYSMSEVKKAEARKVLREIQEYNQTGSMTAFITEKIAIIHSLDKDLSLNESVDFLVEVSEMILAE